jgi:hypothetical protein
MWSGGKLNWHDAQGSSTQLLKYSSFGKLFSWTSCNCGQTCCGGEYSGVELHRCATGVQNLRLYRWGEPAAGVVAIPIVLAGYKIWVGITQLTAFFVITWAYQPEPVNPIHKPQSKTLY